MTAVDRAQLDCLKRDRAQLVAALEAAGAKITGRTVRCPFHPDEHPSGGIHEYNGVWRYTCQACDWNRGKRTGDVLDVVRRAYDCDFARACGLLGLGNAR
jgi:hypothetical protein